MTDQPVVAPFWIVVTPAEEGRVLEFKLHFATGRAPQTLAVIAAALANDPEAHADVSAAVKGYLERVMRRLFGAGLAQWVEMGESKEKPS